MIGKLLFGAIVVAGVGYGYPLWNEGARAPCQALEKRFIGMATTATPLTRPGKTLEWALLRSYVEPLSDGRVAAAQAKQRYPALPPEIGCTAWYWTVLLDPRVQQEVERAMR